MPTVQDYIDMGFSLHQEGNLDEAESKYSQALKMDSENAEACNLMGVLKLQKSDIESAIGWTEKAIALESSAYFYETLFQEYIRAGFFDKIVARQDEILKKFPNNFSLLFNIALAYKNLNKNHEAISFYDKALKINPTSSQAWFNIAHLYSVEAETQNAVSALKICKKLNPNDDEVEYFLGIALMRVKNYDKGLKYFEKRLCREAAYAMQKKTYPNKVREDNLWKGENIKNKTLLVYYEAGFGDVIMFARYLPLVAQKCKKLVHVPKTARSAFQRKHEPRN